MSYPTEGNEALVLADLSSIADQCAGLRKQAEMILCQVRIGLNGGVYAYAVRVNRKGQAGVRGYDIGNLEGCIFQ